MPTLISVTHLPNVPTRMIAALVVLGLAASACASLEGDRDPASAGASAPDGGGPAASGPPVAGEHAVPSTSELHPCAAATERCDGEIRVPLDWTDPESEEITVEFAWVPRGDTAEPAAGTILVSPGGPGAALPMVPWLQDVLGPVLERRNLLVVELRGWGQSDPLLCPSLDPDDPAAVGACAERLGSRLEHFTSAQAAGDMDAVRRAMGVPTIAFYGNSYGTLLAQAYAARYPEGLEALFLDGVVHTRDDGYGMQPVRFRVQDLEMVCDRSPACRALPASGGAIMERLVERLRDAPDPEIPLQALRPLAQGARLVASREAVAAAAAYLAGDALPLRRLTRGFAVQTPGSSEGDDWAGYLAYMCADMWLPYDRSATLDERRRQLEAYYDGEKPLWPLEASEVVEPSLIYERCLAWPSPVQSPPVPRDATYPDVPVLAAAGDFDTATPEEVEEVVGRFPQGTVRHVPFGTHSLAWLPLPHGRCVRELMRAFLSAPRHPPSYAVTGDCTAESFRAVGYFPRTVAGMPPARTEELPSDDRQLVGVVFATAVDAVVRRSPYNMAPPGPPEQEGLRGGATHWDREASTITLDEVRFVDDLAVSGTIHIAPDHAVVAELVATDPQGRTRDLSLEWRAFVAEDETAVRGVLASAPFQAQVPVH
jgi:pimeloyl-ACP methyl ester carboxylesterase